MVQKPPCSTVLDLLFQSPRFFAGRNCSAKNFLPIISTAGPMRFFPDMLPLSFASVSALSNVELSDRFRKENVNEEFHNQSRLRRDKLGSLPGPLAFFPPIGGFCWKSGTLPSNPLFL
jgi:hypothetical protein